MLDRPVALAATLLHAIIGFSGLGVGLSLAVVLASGGGVPANVASGSAAFALATGIVVYGAAGVVGAVGIWGRRPWGRWTAIAVDAVGIAILAWAIALAGPGDVLVSGTALLAIAAALAFFARP